MEYIGKICPFCKTQLTQEDEAVVCSSCEMPHHQSCWVENQGCTTFGCSGTIQGVPREETDFQVHEPLYCLKCGTEHEHHYNFCMMCGNPLNETAKHQKSVNSSYQSTVDDERNDDDLRAFIWVNQPYYLRVFKRFSETSRKISWNWWAFLFAPYWLAYRKMYKYAFCYIGAILLCRLIYPVGSIVILSLAFCNGLFGNYLYKNYAQEQIMNANKEDAQEKTMILETRGGTSTAAVVVCIGIVMMISYVIKLRG